MRDKERESEDNTRWLDLALFVPIASAVVAFLVLFPVFRSTLPADWIVPTESLSQLGGYVGGLVGTAVAFSALILLMKSVMLQKTELKELRAQQELSRFEQSSAPILADALERITEILNNEHVNPIDAGGVSQSDESSDYESVFELPDSASLMLIMRANAANKFPLEHADYELMGTSSEEYHIDGVLLAFHHSQAIKEIRSMILPTLMIFRKLEELSHEKDSPVLTYYKARFRDIVTMLSSAKVYATDLFPDDDELNEW